MRLIAFDVHTHRRSGERKSAETGQSDGARLFGADHAQALPQLDLYRQLGLMGVVFDVDSSSQTGQRSNNDEVVEHCAVSDGLFLPFGSTDPWSGKLALQEIERCAARGVLGMKFQPITQAFFPSDPHFRPMWALCSDLGLKVLIHSGTTAIGSGSPGGRGLRLKYAQPIPYIDDLAAEFPELVIIAAHPGWPWHTDLLAVARHKQNVFIDLSGWGPRYLPEDTFRYMNSVMPEKFLFGSDYPLMQPERWLTDFLSLDVKPASRTKVLFENACQLFGVDPRRFTSDIDPTDPFARGTDATA